MGHFLAMAKVLGIFQAKRDSRQRNMRKRFVLYVLRPSIQLAVVTEAVNVPVTDFSKDRKKRLVDPSFHQALGPYFQTYRAIPHAER